MYITMNNSPQIQTVQSHNLGLFHVSMKTTLNHVNLTKCMDGKI